MSEVIRRARRRLLANELISQAANAFSAALIAFIFLLLTGTELLRWQWLLLVPAAAIGAGIYAAFRRLPSCYITAQIVDRRLGLADALSTAWFFAHTDRTEGRASALMAGGLREEAARIGQTVDIRQAVPLRMPRRLYAVGALALVASSLFALRYGITRRLDLHPPLARILEQEFGFQPKTLLAQNLRRDPPQTGQGEEPSEDPSMQDPNRGTPQASETQDANDGAEPAADKKGSGNRDAQKQAENAEQDAAEQQDEQSAEQQEDQSNPSNSGQQQNRKSGEGKQSGSQGDASGSNESSSLMSKVKDAVQNLLSRVKPQSSQGSQESANRDGKQQQAKNNRQNGKQQSAKDAQRGDTGQQGDAQEGQAGEKADNSGDPQGKGTGKSDGQQNSKQPGSGIGSQDGDKSIKQAEQLAAMGKITEIIGKRSANITGEATVDVQSTAQQLRTPYAQRAAKHDQGGAEIDRDEIPVALQAYVEKYFEQIRKQGGKK
jgi:hypothetical protein